MSNLEKLRQQIDKIDKRLLEVLSERFKVARKIGIFKEKHNLPVCDKKREKDIFRKRNLQAQKLKLDPVLVEKIFKLIIEKVKENHKAIKNSKK